MDVEKEIMGLKRRVSDLEGAVDVLSGQMRNVVPEITALKTLSLTRLDSIDGTMMRFVSRLDAVNTQVWSLRDDLPDLVGEAIRRSLGARRDDA